MKLFNELYDYNIITDFIIREWETFKISLRSIPWKEISKRLRIIP